MADLVGTSDGDVLVGTSDADVIEGMGGGDMLTGNDGDDILNGGSGADTMSGGTGYDTYIVDNVDDIVDEAESPIGGIDRVESSVSFTTGATIEYLVLTGTAAINGTTLSQGTIIGNAAANTLDGGHMEGGDGDDTYIVNWSGDYVIEDNPDGGTDLVISPAYYFILDLHVENITLVGSAIKATGNWAANTIIGNAETNELAGMGGNDYIDGGTGADMMWGGDGNDTFVVDNARDQIWGEVGVDTAYISVNFAPNAYSGLENFILTGDAAISVTGNELANHITGNSAANRMDGGAGADTMAGGDGDDTYVIDTLQDRMIETANGGRDTVITGLHYELGENLENLILTGFENSDGTGNALDNRLTGNDFHNRLEGRAGNDVLLGGLGSDTLVGGSGADEMRGGVGDDTYQIDNVGDRTYELAGQGTDTVYSAITHTLLVNVENLSLFGTANVNGAGNALANIIDGNDGRNLINGLAGADTMRGGLGNDTYIVDNAGDQVIETADAGTDTVQSSITFTLGDNVERLYLTGAGNVDGFGNTLANAINGNSGANRLDGGAGADVMRGGLGNDTYLIDMVGDLTLESSASGGVDTVESAIAWTLAANVENLVLTGGASVNGAGNGLANSLTGNSGNNLLNGLAGADRMTGGDGNDAYVVDNVGDQAIEVSGAGGVDRVQSSVSFVLGENVENLTLTGGGDRNGTGNALDNALTGNGGANVLTGFEGSDTLRGGAGNDTLRGGLGSDILSGGSGTDSFVFDAALDGVTNVDMVLGYSAADDRLFLDDAAFAGLASGALVEGAFHTGAAAADADDRIIYNSATGVLLFDADGVGGAAAVQFATLSPGLAMTASEFTVI